MSGLKLKTIHVIIIGSLACISIVAGLYFLVIKKSSEQITSLTAEYQQYEQKWNQKASVEAKLEAAKQNYRIAQAKYEKYVREKMPTISFEKREEGMIALWKEQAEVLGPLVESWPRKTGVRFNGSVKIPDPPHNPNNVTTSLIGLDLGDFEVAGEFQDILDHVRSWNKFNRLVLIGPLSLSMSDNGMTGKYKLSVYIYPQGGVGSTVAMAGAGASAQGAAAGMLTPSPSAGAPDEMAP